MSCCHAAANPLQPAIDLEEDRLRAASHHVDADTLRTEFHVPGMHCIGCVRRIERSLARLPFVFTARANLSTRRVRITWNPSEGKATQLGETLAGEGFEHAVLQLGLLADADDDKTQKHLLMCLGVAGFAAANVMLLSVSVWSGADGQMRQLFHLISGLIAIPAAIYSGRPFFTSAMRALAHRRLNMDVPISLAIILALGMSIVESLNGGEHAYFDAALMLLFFLLIGRTLDHMMRSRARHAVKLLSGLAAKGAVQIMPDGTYRYVTAETLEPGDRIFVAAGERLPVDGEVRTAHGEIDRSLVTGESAPVAVTAGDHVEAGTINIAGPLEIVATKAAAQSFLGEVIAMMEAAENGKARFVRIADRAAQLYAPSVHLLAAATFVGWFFVSNGDWQVSLYTAIAVLIITCPCALGLAVPIAHVVGAGRLFDQGVLMKDGSAFERLCEVDTVVFDKTGTLTRGRPTVQHAPSDRRLRALAYRLGRASHHPLAQAIMREVAEDASATTLDPGDIRETPGLGIEARFDGRRVRLGKRDWVLEIAAARELSPPTVGTAVWLAEEGRSANCFTLSDALRSDARETIASLQDKGLDVLILSGDTVASVRQVSDSLAIPTWHADCSPADKIAHLNRLGLDGRKILMVGDGLNDAPALAASHVSMAPSSGSDVARQAADFVFTGDSLRAVSFAHRIALHTDRLVKQNIALAVLYNCVAVPLATLGYVTPLVAAVAMSASSILVVSNSLRLRWIGRAAGSRSSARGEPDLTPNAGLRLEPQR